MCIIMVKMNNITLPTESIRQAMANNSDGAGYAILKRGRVTISKGYFDSEDLIIDLERENARECCLIVHARIATSGSVNMSNCHPFPITKDVAMLTGRYLVNETAIAHNGTVRWGTKKELNAYSDTLLFIRDVLAPVWDTGDTETGHNLLSHIASANRCRFAVMHSKGINVFGSGWIQDDGVYYSNDTYKPRKNYGELRKYSDYGGWEKCSVCGRFNRAILMYEEQGEWYCIKHGKNGRGA